MTSRLALARRHSIWALLTAAAIFAAVAVFDLVAHPASQHALSSYKEYVLTATIFPAVAAVLWVLVALEALQSDHRERIAGIGLRVAAIGLSGLVVDAIVTLASANTDTAGPLYPIAMLATLIGIVLLAIGWHRARRLPRWIGPALAIGWFLGATPIIGDGSMLILAAAFLAIAAGLRHNATAALTAPVEMDASATA
ncbi:MAG: hypothetical protein JO286_23880 [Solirubrobacterales bacterium]|nr:hypothetical protein [Solirubrobacterales bacterium]